MSNPVKIVFAVIVCVCMMAIGHHADDAGSCEPVLNAMETCRTYLKQGGTVPATCCKGVKSLNTAATTPAVKRTYCECLKTEAKALGVNSQFASSLPTKCNVNIGYPISYNVNCSR